MSQFCPRTWASRHSRSRASKGLCVRHSTQRPGRNLRENTWNPRMPASAGADGLRCSGATEWPVVCFRLTLTSPSELRAPFSHGSDREADDKVPDATGHGFVPASRRATEKSMQLPSLTDLKTRLRDRVDDSARGTDVPAGIDRGANAVAPTGSRERGRMR